VPGGEALLRPLVPAATCELAGRLLAVIAAPHPPTAAAGGGGGGGGGRVLLSFARQLLHPAAAPAAARAAADFVAQVRADTRPAPPPPLPAAAGAVGGGGGGGGVFRVEARLVDVGLVAEALGQRSRAVLGLGRVAVAAAIGGGGGGGGGGGVGGRWPLSVDADVGGAALLLVDDAAARLGPDPGQHASPAAGDAGVDGGGLLVQLLRARGYAQVTPPAPPALRRRARPATRRQAAPDPAGPRARFGGWAGSRIRFGPAG
jgi:hypothetical protein